MVVIVLKKAKMDTIVLVHQVILDIIAKVLNIHLIILNKFYIYIFTESTKCEPNPCLNGGSCFDYGDYGHYCTCSKNYTGDNCESIYLIFKL